MKFRFESSAKEFDIPTDDGRILSVDEFLTLVNNLFFKDKEPTCSFNVTNLHKQDIIECDVCNTNLGPVADIWIQIESHAGSVRRKSDHPQVITVAVAPDGCCDIEQIRVGRHRAPALRAIQTEAG